MIIRPKIKICGIKDLVIANLSIKLGADYLGFVCYDQSIRNISLKKIKDIINELDHNIPIFIVTVNPTNQFIEKMLSYFKPDYLQIHGEISITAIEAIKKNYQLKLVRALSHSELNQKIINELENIVDFILIDSAAKADGYGGSGKVFDWLSLKNYNFNKDYFLSGGLSKNNIKRALELSQAKFIDLSSALEEPKGHKSSAKIIEFFDNFNNEFLQ